MLALATTPNDLMGLGEANFKVNRPTEIRPVMPNQVREGDEFNAGFSVMNRTDKTRTIKVTVTATGDVQDVEKASKEETLTIEPYKRATVLLPLKTSLLPVTRDVAEGKISFSGSVFLFPDFAFIKLINFSIVVLIDYLFLYSLFLHLFF